MITDLSEDLIEGGYRVLFVAENLLGIPVEGAMWIYHHKHKDWRLYFVTSLVDVIGQKETEQRLSEVFKAPGANEVFPPELNIGSIDVASPTENYYRLISAGLAGIVPTSGKNRVKISTGNINGLTFEGLIYRARPTPSSPSKGGTASTAEKPVVTNKSERGLVISPPIFLRGDAFSMGGPLDHQELRASLLFWDKLDAPMNKLGYAMLDAEGEFLSGAGILKRTVVDVSEIIPDRRVEMKEMPHLCLYTHMQGFTQLDTEEPGVWSIGAGYNSVSIPTQQLDQGRGVLVQLYQAIPVPDKSVPLQDILEFRDKRRAELLALRYHLDAIYQRVLVAGDGPLALNSEIAQLDGVIANQIKTSKESKLKMKLMSLDANLNVTAATLIAAATAYKFELGVVGALLAGASAFKISTGVSLKGREAQSTPFRYVSSFHRDL